MSKALLVIEMPVLCEDCPISYENDYRNMCPIIGSHHNTENERPDWCPLIPMLQKKERSNVSNNYNGGYSHGYVAGWNACIDTMIGCNENDKE